MMTKFASLENAQVLGIKGSSERRTASLDKFADFSDYRTEDGYLYARIRAISSRVNKNHDGWPSVELAGSPEIFDQHTSATGGFTVEARQDVKYGFSTFLGKPIFVDHNNSDPSRARGVVVDAKLHVEDHKTAAEHDSYYSSAPDNHLPPTWVELLLEVDAKSFPRLAKAIIEGAKNPKKGIDGFSMGCNVEKSVCSICKNAATAPDEFCKHIKLKGHEFTFTDPRTKRKTSAKSYEDCYGIQFFEISAVFDPADETALLREVKSHTANAPEDGFAGPELSGVVACPECQGIGRTVDNDYCPFCDGNGSVIPHQPGSDGIFAPDGDHFQLPHSVYTPRPQGDLGPMHQGSLKTADNPLPQEDLVHAPEDIDTLREEKSCPVCGSNMDEETCDICGYTEPPEHFNNPDLEKAKHTDLNADQSQERTNEDEPMLDLGPENQAPPAQQQPNNPQAFAHVKNSMQWELSYTGGVVRPNEQPLTSNTSASNEPKDETIIRDQTTPVTSSVRTARDFLAAAGRNQRTTTMEHTAEAASGAPSVAKPDVRTDVVGVGGVEDASNEAASQADKQIDVTGIGGTGVSGVEAESTQNVEQGDEHSKNVEAIHTDTWHGDKGDSLGQHEPVSNDPFPASAEGVKASKWVVSLNDAPFPEEDGGLAGGNAVQGVQPADPFFKAEDRVDVLDHVTSPENNSGPTKTWSGTDGNGVLRQQDPVTPQSIALGDEPGPYESEPATPGAGSATRPTSSHHIFAAFRLADLEVEMGLINPDQKYARVAQLEQEAPSIVEASLRYAERVKTAGLSKKVATRLPVMGQSPVVKEAATEPQEENQGDPDFLW